MSSPNHFSFMHFAPGEGDPRIAEQAIRLMQADVWRRESIDQAKVDEERAKHLVVAILPDDQVVAAGAMEFYSSDYCYVTDLATDLAYRQKHRLGGKLLTMLEETARSTGGQEIGLSALSGSRTFFEKRGYQPDPTPSISLLGMIKML